MNTRARSLALYRPGQETAGRRRGIWKRSPAASGPRPNSIAILAMNAAANRRCRPTKAPAPTATLPRYGARRAAAARQVVSHRLRRPRGGRRPAPRPPAGGARPAICAGPPSPCRIAASSTPTCATPSPTCSSRSGARPAHRRHGCTCSWSINPAPIAGYASACSSTAAASGTAPAGSFRASGGCAPSSRLVFYQGPVPASAPRHRVRLPVRRRGARVALGAELRAPARRPVAGESADGARPVARLVSCNS